MDEEQRCYGNDRLEALVGSMGDVEPAQAAAAIEADVRAFAGAAEQADDITILVLRYRGGRLEG